MNFLVGAVHDLSLARSPETIRRIAASAARALTGADGASFVVRENDECAFVDEDAEAKLWVGRRLDFDACVSGWAMRSRAPFIVGDLHGDARLPRGAYRPADVRSVAAVPIRSADPVGAISVYWRTAQTPGDDAIKLLQGLADATEIALDRVHGAAALRAVEERLRDVQRTETLGKLAGGIAHDFKNMLSVILSYSALLLEELPSDDGHRRDIEEIRTAGERATALSSQLLEVSRRSTSEPTEIDLNAICEGLRTMLERVVGGEITLELRLADGLEATVADRGQLEQVLMNLVFNARDAMPAGGTLTIETANIHVDDDGARPSVDAAPGDYVMLAVRDDGVGMDSETMSHIFDPFFTTKPPGEGTGLGLWTVLATVKGCGGQVAVESQPSNGATFRVYLPAAAPHDERSQSQRSAHREGRVRSSGQRMHRRARPSDNA